MNIRSLAICGAVSALVVLGAGVSAQPAPKRDGWWVASAPQGTGEAIVSTRSAQGQEYWLLVSCYDDGNGRKLWSEFSNRDCFGDCDNDKLATQNTIIEAHKGNAVLSRFKVNGVTDSRGGRVTKPILDTWKTADKFVARSGAQSLTISARGSTRALNTLSGWGC